MKISRQVTVRQLILLKVLKKNSHMTVKEIHESMPHDYNVIQTIYGTLTMFKIKKIITCNEHRQFSLTDQGIILFNNILKELAA